MSSYEELHVILDDGYEAYARYWPAPGCSAAVLHIHGIQSHCGWYTETAQSINAAGFAVLQPDRRGSGRNRDARGHADSPQQLLDDGLCCLRRLQELAEVKPVHVIGVSWGGKQAACMHVAAPDLAASLALVAPGIFAVIDVSSAEKFRIGWSMVSNPTKQFDIPLNDPELFTDQPEWIQFLRDDPLQLHQATAGFFLASRRMDRICAKIRQAPAVPLHVFLAGNERIIDNEATRNLVRDLPWPHRHVTTYARSRHTLEFGADRDAYLADLIAWLKNPKRS